MLLAAAEALRAEHAVTVRAPLPEADERTPALFPSRPLAGLGPKLAVLPRLARLVAVETLALRRLRPDLIHVHDEPSLYVYGLAARALHPRPVVLWHLHAEPGTGRTLRLRRALADACLTISPHVTSPPGLPARLVRNPLALAPASLPPVPGDAAHLGLVGAIGPRKGQDIAVEALALLRQGLGGAGARLTLIGPELDPGFAAALRRRIEILGLGAAVVFAGSRPPETAFAGVGLALFPSRAETQPLALAEAMARGLPVIASDIPAHRALFGDLGEGREALCPLNPEAFRDAMLCPPVPPAERAGRIRALLDPGRFAADLRASVQDLLARRGPRGRLRRAGG